MKDFEEFKKTLTQEALDKWSQNASDAVDKKLEPIRESDPETYFCSRPTMYSFHVTMQLLEAYHNWLKE